MSSGWNARVTEWALAWQVTAEDVSALCTPVGVGAPPLLKLRVAYACDEVGSVVAVVGFVVVDHPVGDLLRLVR